MRKLTQHSYLLASLALLGLVLAQPHQASAQNNPYPVGPLQVLDGDAITSTYTQYTVNFTGTGNSADITFAFRDDPGFIAFDSASVVDLANPSTNLLTNSGFDTGDLTGWTYDNIFGATFGGVVSAGNTANCPIATQAGSSLWCDGAVGSYDAIDQVIGSTIAGDTYQISYYAAAVFNDGGDANYQEFCNNSFEGQASTSCNAVDLAVYAQAGVPVSGNAPEPASMLLFGTGLATLGFLGRRRAKKQ